ncbi:formin-like protein 8 [Iris pallida]|uniref:Formin-like protein 8 n=1 Tax=Iris pallida TaxID=29817 RepID=A0AAX6HRR7_IRIPA|nr:formin-like protein 8 [Iris pallida]
MILSCSSPTTLISSDAASKNPFISSTNPSAAQPFKNSRISPTLSPADRHELTSASKSTVAAFFTLASSELSPPTTGRPSVMYSFSFCSLDALSAPELPILLRLALRLRTHSRFPSRRTTSSTTKWRSVVFPSALFTSESLHSAVRLKALASPLAVPAFMRLPAFRMASSSFRKRPRDLSSRQASSRVWRDCFRWRISAS